MSRITTPRAAIAPILTAAEFQAQGTTAAQVLSISKAVRDKKTAADLRATAFEIAGITGEKLKESVPGYAARSLKYANDNRRRQRRAA